MNADAGGYLANAFAVVGLAWAVAWYCRWQAYYDSLKPPEPDECEECGEIGADLDIAVGALENIVVLADQDIPPGSMVAGCRAVAARALERIIDVREDEA